MYNWFAFACTVGVVGAGTYRMEASYVTHLTVVCTMSGARWLMKWQQLLHWVRQD